MSSKQNQLAKHFSSLHVSGKPLVLANVYDCATTNAMLSLRPQLQAIATASYGIANVAGLNDYTMTLEAHIEAVTRIGKIVASTEPSANGNLGIPLSIDIVDGYGSRLSEAIKNLIEIGAVGCNIEDSYFDPATMSTKLYTVEKMKSRLTEAKKVAIELGVPDFVFNVRTDAVFVQDGCTMQQAMERGKVEQPIDEAIVRGRMYLSTGVPTTIFIWAGPLSVGTSSESLKRYVKEFGGRVAVHINRGDMGGLSVDELGKLGVARISIGPEFLFQTMGVIKELARGILGGGHMGTLTLKA
ncbi:Phosphoenolpyruvate/pyruvate domain-containing protein [Marasmius fiardii PR-910]|nr:Phosphoenolpyruvate/pyruvate domain-containing protein [Marasmius fiardii PR-910]